MWATYYGGSSSDEGIGVTTDGSGNVYITGFSSSTSAIATSGAYQTTYGGGGNDAFLAKFSSSGGLLWATYYGGSDIDNGLGVATDGSGNSYITGYTHSTTGIATSGAYQTAFAGGVNDAYLAKFSSTGTLQWATYYGGSGADEAYGVAADGTGNAFITGNTASTTGIATTGAYQATLTGSNAAFLAKFNTSGAIQWATYYSSSGGANIGYCAAVGTAGNVSVAGPCLSINVFLVVFTTSGGLQFDTTYAGADYAKGVATDGSGNIYITGYTNSTSGIATSGAYQTTFGGGGWDAYLAKFSPPCTAPPIVSPITGPTTVCPGNTITLANATAGGTWSSGNPAIATVTGGVVTGVAVGNVLLSYSVTNSCGTTSSATMITVGNAVITTIAGNGTNGFTGNGGPATAALVSGIAGIVSDAAGNIYIVDEGNNQIRKINTLGIITAFAGTGTAGYTGDGGLATAATISDPNGIAIDPSGNIYFADRGNNVIREVNTSGIISTFAGNGIAGSLGDGTPATAAELSYCNSVGIDKFGNFYITDAGNCLVLK